MTLRRFEAKNPIVVPETACGHYLPVAQLMRRWDWAKTVEESLITGKTVPHAVVAEYLEKTTGALPPSRRKDYPDLAAKYPECYVEDASGKRVAYEPTSV